MEIHKLWNQVEIGWGNKALKTELLHRMSREIFSCSSAIFCLFEWSLGGGGDGLGCVYDDGFCSMLVLGKKDGNNINDKNETLHRERERERERKKRSI